MLLTSGFTSQKLLGNADIPKNCQILTIQHAHPNKKISERPNTLISFPSVATADVTNPEFPSKYGNLCPSNPSKMFNPTLSLQTSSHVYKSQCSPIKARQHSDSLYTGLNTPLPTISPPPPPAYQPPQGGVIPANFIQTEYKLHNSKLTTHV